MSNAVLNKKSSWLRNLLAVLLVMSCFFLALIFSLRTENPYPGVCNLVAEKIFLPQKEITDWKRVCLRRAQLVKPWTSRDLILKDINHAFELLHVSHLEVFAPLDAKKIWSGQNLETGIESEFVDGELVVFKVHLGSSAEKAGLKYGDVIVSLNSEHPNPWQLQGTGGVVVYRRGVVEKKVRIQTAELQRSEKIEVRAVKNQGKKSTYVIGVPSFRKEFFQKNALLEFPELKSASRIVIDLRGNRGGNFVAGLRFLANFICTPQTIGRLEKPRAQGKPVLSVPDDLDDLKQLEVLESAKIMLLKTPPSPLCLKARLHVLVDAKSASVAELVAQALKEYAQARIEGAPSAGQLLVGVWYPMDELGSGVQISIPEALYLSGKAHRIEGQGVEVDQRHYYNLREMQQGQDSWLKRIAN